LVLVPVALLIKETALPEAVAEIMLPHEDVNADARPLARVALVEDCP
jgi:hypothetical protein